MEKLHFKTSSGIKSIVGRDLITDKFVAIFELVKNSYDAKAKNVIVSFNNLHYINKNPNIKEESLYIDTNQPHIIIADDGQGMDKEALINKWLYLAYSEKQEGHQNDERLFVGSKGVGRFSCDTLGEVLNIRTKKSHENIEHQLLINWANFEQDLLQEFNKIDVIYNSETINNDKQYTILTIGKLRHTIWQDEKEQFRAKQNLSRLKNPFVEDNSFNIYLGENIEVNNPDPKNKVTNNIASILKGKTTTIEASINSEININLYDRGELIYSASKPNDTILKNTPINISINYLNPSAKNIFSRLMGIQPVRYGNIFIYKNDFRVMPYGEEDYDLFGLNLRKTQGHSRYIATREIIGYISIHDKNHNFKESSSRNNGFIENIFFNTLTDIYLSEIHTSLERYITLIKWGENSYTKEEIFFDEKIDKNEVKRFKQYITKYKKYNITYFKDNIEIEKNNPEVQLETIIDKIYDKSIKETVKDVKNKVVQLKQDNNEKDKLIENNEKEILYLNKQNQNLKKLREPSSYSEQISHHFKTMSEDLYFATEDLIELIAKIKEENFQKTALIHIGKIRSTINELNTFRDLLINTNLDLRAKQLVNLYELTQLYIINRSKQSYGLKVINNITDEKFINNWKIYCNALEFHIALDNFYQNAKEHKASFLDILFEENKIIFSSDSNKIDKLHLKNIFNLGYSTKPNGTGIGLHQISNFFNKSECDISVEQPNNLVNFVVTKRS